MMIIGYWHWRNKENIKEHDNEILINNKTEMTWAMGDIYVIQENQAIDLEIADLKFDEGKNPKKDCERQWLEKRKNW